MTLRRREVIRTRRAIVSTTTPFVRIDSYITRCRPLLLGEAEDPGTFFVKTVKRTSRDASYNQNTFYGA